MSATPLALETLEALERATPAPRGRVREGIRSAVILAPAKDGHTHCALFNGETGEGFTTPGPDGHVHKMKELEIQPANGHAHDVARRCLLPHDRHTGQHVTKRR